MKSDVNNKLKEIWKIGRISRKEKDRTAFTEKSVYDAMGHIFCPGPFYFYIFDFSRLDFVYLHPNIEQVLGLSPEEISIQSIGNFIPKEDQLHIQRCEAVTGDFLFKFIAPDKIKKYKISYCFRINTRYDTQLLILHQAVALSVDEDYKIAATLGVQTDISHLVSFNNKKISFIGIDGEPSYLGIDLDRPVFEAPTATPSHLTHRETEVLQYLAEGDTVKEISEKLILSEHTIRTHRNNIRKKLGCKNTAQAVGKAIRAGLI
jgi:DNA-binding CsgD family transcriptional regulator